MLISLIIPVYKVEKYIKDCLHSVISQSYNHFECIIVDDKTPDRSMEFVNQIVDSYDGNIIFRIFQHDNNMGLPNARNTGILNATGDYLLFLDSDDTLSADCIETMVGLVNKYPAVDLIQCDILDTKRRIYDISKLPVFCEGEHNIFRELLCMHMPWMAVGKLVRRKFLLEKDLLFDSHILIHEDLLWTYFICQKASSFASSRSIVYYYNSNNSDSIMNQSDLHFERSAHYYIKILNILLSNIDNENLADNRLFIENFFFYVGTTIDKSDDISNNTHKDYKQLRDRLLKSAWKNFNIPEMLYLIHLYSPFKKLLHLKFYRRYFYLFEKMIRWAYMRM